ncbi:MAG: WD40 repeat domain-containing protein [Muribaculaceae bacterium]|nr:WD40 repeat domain-containing protein [Muribaculaceae bacterium]
MLSFHHILRGTGTMLTIALFAIAANGQGNQSRNDYDFKFKKSPEHITRFQNTLYAGQEKKVMTISGKEIAELPQPLTGLEISPAGINFLALTNGKKPAAVYLYNTRLVDDQIKKFSNKKYGVPSGVGYTSDAKWLLVATDKGILQIDPKTFEVVKTIPAEFQPSTLLMSTDGYYLAATDGHTVTVYNFEESKPRKTWKLDENVTEIRFSPDNSQFAVLTDDGLLSIYDTRNFSLKQDVDELGEAIDFDYNFDGKYVAVATSPSTVEVINLLRPTERETVKADTTGITRLYFVPDSRMNTLLAYNQATGIHAKRMHGLEPYYGKLMNDEVASLMNEWMKMRPGETMDEYKRRVNDESRANQQRLFEDEISTRFANNLISMAEVTLGKYDRASQMLEVDFNNMPSIFLPVPEADVTSFNSPGELEFYDTQYGLLPDDSFELIYAKVRHSGTGKSYTYDNLARKTLSFMEGDDNVVSIAVIQQQQMEEMKLQELRERIIAEAKKANVISDHTHITVDSRVEPSYDANGKKILNYIVSFTYEVEPEFSAKEDFGPGKYHIDESGAASSMLRIVKEAFEGDMAKYVASGKKLNVKISGTADASPIISNIPYDGVYGDFEDEVVYKNNALSTVSVKTKERIKENEQLAFLRAFGVKDFLDKNVDGLKDMTTDYRYLINVAEGKGAEFRRITADFTFVDVF